LLNLPSCIIAFQTVSQNHFGQYFPGGNVAHRFLSHPQKFFASQRLLGNVTKNYVEVPWKNTNRQLEDSTLISAIHQASP
jgi:hypothetical protein